MYLDDQAKWKDIYYRLLLCKENYLNTEMETMTLASRESGDLSRLTTLTLAFPSAQKTAWQASDPYLTAPSYHSGLSVDVTFSETFLDSLSVVAGSLSFPSVQCSLFSCLVLIAYLLLYIYCVALPYPHPKPASLPASTDLHCPIHHPLATLDH